MSAEFKENVIEFLEHEKFAYVTFTEERYINRIMKIAETNKQCVILEKTRSHVYAKIPTDLIQIRQKARYTDEQRQAMRDRASEMFTSPDLRRS